MNPFNVAEPLATFPVAIQLPVQWGDQDAFSHVNNTVYFRWCESARIEYLNRLEMNDRSDRAGIGPILAAIGCNYRRPVTYPDSVQIGARVTRLGRSSVTMEHLIYSESQRQVVADASSTIVVFDYQSQKSQFIPDKVREIIELLEGKKFDGG